MSVTKRPNPGFAFYGRMHGAEGNAAYMEYSLAQDNPATLNKGMPTM